MIMVTVIVLGVIAVTLAIDCMILGRKAEKPKEKPTAQIRGYVIKRGKYKDAQWECSKCGKVVMHDDSVDVASVRYCPICGAEIVSMTFKLEGIDESFIPIGANGVWNRYTI